ncbi:hypothetical protein D9M72_351230 [compost metagenome]
MTDVAQGMAEVFIGGCRSGAPGGQGSGDGKRRKRQPAFAPSSGGQLVQGRTGGCGLGGGGGRQCHGERAGVGRFGRNSGKCCQRCGRRHQRFHRGGRPRAVGGQCTQFQQDGTQFARVFHAGVSQQFVDDPLVPE